jgi:hypothetical protein
MWGYPHDSTSPSSVHLSTPAKPHLQSRFTSEKTALYFLKRAQPLDLPANHWQSINQQATPTNRGQLTNSRLAWPAPTGIKGGHLAWNIHYVELALNANDTAIIATSRKPTLLVSYLESYLNDLQRWLSEWRIAINISKSTAIIFARAVRRFIQPRPVTLFGEPLAWVETTRYLGVTLDKRLTWSPHIGKIRRKTAQRMGMLGPSLIGRVISPSGTESCYISRLSAP